MTALRRHFHPDHDDQQPHQASQKKRRVALFGGSFNPPHDGHFEMMSIIAKELDVDQIWMMFSQNRFKDPDAYAPFDDIIEMSKIMKSHYPDLPLKFSQAEQESGTNITADVLRYLKDKHPDIEFVWVMGSDNLAQFHDWKDAEYIIKNFEICAVNRPGYEDALTESVTAKQYPHLLKQPSERLDDQSAPGWSYLQGLDVNMSSSGLMTRLRAGETEFDGPFQDVADYIIANKLYGIGADHDAQPKPNQPSNSNSQPKQG